MALPIVEGASERRQEAVASCTGAVALRRVTQLLAGARQADNAGLYSEAIELYSEVLKVHRSISRAPLGSIGKSLREVAAGVEVRLAALRQEDGSSWSVSRPSGTASVRGQSSLDEIRSPRAVLSSLTDCPRQGDRPPTSTWRDVGGFETSVRPSTRSGFLENDRCLDGFRPSTKEGRGLQKMIDGKRPETRDGRPGTRNGTGDRRSLDVSVRQVSNSRRKQGPPDILVLDEAQFPGDCLSPCADVDESVDLLE